MRGVAVQLGLRFCDTTKDRSYKQETGGLPDHLPLFASADFDTTVSDLSYGTFAGYPVQVFSYDAVVYRDEPEKTNRTCVLFKVPAVFPALTIAPHSRLSMASRRTSQVNPFTLRFQTIGRDTEFQEALLDDNMQKWLAGLPDGMRIEINRDAVLAHVGLTDPEEVPGMVTTLFTFMLQIPELVMSRWGTGH